MSTQVQFLGNLINSAKTGNEAAVTLLRQLCSIASNDAPADDLITLSECLYHIGVEADRRSAERN
jgi:hypothetical protein